MFHNKCGQLLFPFSHKSLINSIQQRTAETAPGVLISTANKKTPPNGRVFFKQAIILLPNTHAGTTFAAEGPFGPCSILNVTCWPSDKVLNPEPLMAE
jgi:hypothetical protein